MKRFNRAVLATVLGLVCAGAANGKETRQKEGAHCLHYSQANDSTARVMTLKVDNACAVDMTCALSWRVTCVSATGRTTTNHDEGGLVATGSARSWDASGASCAAGDGYEISAPTWTCSPVASDTARR